MVEDYLVLLCLWWLIVLNRHELLNLFAYLNRVIHKWLVLLLYHSDLKFFRTNMVIVICWQVNSKLLSVSWIGKHNLVICFNVGFKWGVKFELTGDLEPVELSFDIKITFSYLLKVEVFEFLLDLDSFDS